MNRTQKIGIGLIIVTWLVARLSAFYNVPFFSNMSWKIGIVVSMTLTFTGVILYFVEVEKPKENNNHKNKEGKENVKETEKSLLP